VNPPVTAIISKEWKQRMLLMTLIIAGAGAWFLYDGLWAWPQNNTRWEVYAPLKEQFGKDTPELEKAWTAAARERGWSDTPPKKKYEAGDLRTQIIISIVAFIGAGLCARNYFVSLKTTTRLEDDVIILPDKRKIPLNKVRSISMKRWKNKGIADLTYEAGPGQLRKFVLDDYKYVGAEEILKAAEKALPKTDSSPAKSDDAADTSSGNY
jgi:hypothetical protein